MKRSPWVSAIVLGLLPILASGQELDLRSYLSLLRSAPGSSLESKIEYLEARGITLSGQGHAQLERLTATTNGNRSNDTSPGSFGNQPSATTPYSDGLQPSYSLTPERPRSTWPSSSYQNLYQPITPAQVPSTSTSQRIGNQTYYQFSNGTTGNSQRIGSMTYYNFSNGQTDTSQQIGGITYRNSSTGSTGTSQQIGNITYHNNSNGVSGTSQQIGNITYHNFSDGTHCTSQKVGNQTYTNCN